MTLPMVTAARLCANPPSVSAGKLEGATWAIAQKASGAACFTISPKPIKYMFATACSKPAATNAAIGNTVRIARWAGRRLDSDSQMARHTKVLQSMPSTTARCERQRCFRLGDAQRCQADLAATEHVMASQQRKQSDTQRADQIADPYQRPDAEHAQRLQPAAGPRHDHQHIAGEDLRAADEHQAEAEGKDQAGHHACNAEWQHALGAGQRHG